jgi:hypothetical protein
MDLDPTVLFKVKNLRYILPYVSNVGVVFSYCLRSYHICEKLKEFYLKNPVHSNRPNLDPFPWGCCVSGSGRMIQIWIRNTNKSLLPKNVDDISMSTSVHIEKYFFITQSWGGGGVSNIIPIHILNTSYV